MKIEETETKSELKQVEETETVTRIQCDVCGHAYDEDEWDGDEFCLNPSIDGQFHSIKELSDVFDAYHVDIPTDVIDDSYDGSEMKYVAERKDLLEVLSEEIPIASKFNEKCDKRKIAAHGIKQKYADKLGTYNFYLHSGDVHHFMYELNIEESSDDYKHICDDCYTVMFNE